ncbi:hypothetical protein ACQY0O_003304 [Thecaphora frezii]
MSLPARLGFGIMLIMLRAGREWRRTTYPCRRHVCMQAMGCGRKPKAASATMAARRRDGVAGGPQRPQRQPGKLGQGTPLREDAEVDGSTMRTLPTSVFEDGCQGGNDNGRVLGGVCSDGSGGWGRR